jgi:TldD protein
MDSDQLGSLVSLTRRGFIKKASVAAATAALVPSTLRAAAGSGHLIHVPSSGAGDPDLHALAARAVEAARAAGATYADARLTITRSHSFFSGFPSSEQEVRGIGVRALVNGYWGFLSSATWTPEEATRLAVGAVAQARAHGRGKKRPVDMGPAPRVAKGEWVMPVKYDPFNIPIGEKMDVINAAHDFARSYRAGINAMSSMSFVRQIKVFASSEGASWSQTTYTSAAGLAITYPSEYHARLPGGGAGTDFLSPAGRGWEYVSDPGLIDAIPRLIEEAEQSRHTVPVEVGRYDIVFSAQAMAALVDSTLGPATELDRALGFEANAQGTSYLNEPLEMLGSYQIGSPLLTVRGDRSTPGGAATVKWDDEGVEPEEFTLIRDGILVDYQTTREQAAWLAPYYQRVGRPVRSHGCAGAGSALHVTMQHSPNLALMPGTKDVSFDDMVAGTKKGIAVLSLSTNMDQQSLNGTGRGAMREIEDGKLGRFIRGAAIVFRAPELWKSVVAIGGPRTSALQGESRGKGQPHQNTTHSVAGVPAKATQVSVIDVMRKA